MGNGLLFELRHRLQPSPLIFCAGRDSSCQPGPFGMSLIGAVRTFPITTSADAVELVDNGIGYRLSVFEQQRRDAGSLPLGGMLEIEPRFLALWGELLCAAVAFHYGWQTAASR